MTALTRSSAMATLMLCIGLGVGCRTHPPPVPDQPPPPPEPIPPIAATPAKVRPDGAIFRSEVVRATERGPAYLMRQLQPVPHRPAGRFAGWQITALFPDDPSLCDECDLAVGDVIIAVNGNPLERPEQLSALLQELEDTKGLEVVRVRDGVREIKRYPIVADLQDTPP